jgi:hypothetical protein
VIRGLIAVALGASMLHLNVARADRACATHVHGAGAHAQQGEHASHGTMRHHASPSHAQHGVTADESCDTPAQADCCEAVVSCSVALGLDDSVRPATGVALHANLIAAAPQRAPASRTTAPEPPPPRA